MLMKLTPGFYFTFYKLFFNMKVFCAAFLYLQFVLAIFWRKEISPKATPKMLVKLITGGVKFTDIL